MILDDLKVIFFHIGKAGGSTIERVLSSFSIHKDLIHHPTKSPLYGNVTTPEAFILRKKFMMGMLPHTHATNGVWSTYLQHADIKIFQRIHNENNYMDYLKFTFVRNPFDRILSAYYYNGIDKKTPFEEFVISGDLKGRCEGNLNRNTQYFTNHFAPQHMFTHINDLQYVNYIGKLEDFENDFTHVLKMLNLKYDNPFPVLSKTKKSKIYNNYMDAYNEEMCDVIYNVYKKDFILFDYY